MENFKVKICHVANTDMAVRFLLFNQLKFLKKLGYNVYAVCSSGSLIKDVEKQGIKVKTIDFNRGFNLFAHLIAFFKLFFYFKKKKFDVVHTHNPVPGFLGQLAAKMAGVPIIINTIHGFYFQERDSWLKRNFLISIEKIAAKCSDLIFSQNKEDIKTAVKEKICNLQKIKYLGNGIDIQKFNGERFSKEFIDKKKRELNLDSNFKIIGIIGRLVKEKGYLELFEAFKKVLNKFPDIILLVIGPEEPKKKDKIKQNIIKNYGIEKNVLFLGQRTDIDELYPLFDIFVLPSHREGFPRTIIEAQAAARPVIATDIRGCREAIDDGKTGILVPQKNSEKLAEAIGYLLLSPERAKDMGKAGRKKIEREFNEKIIFDRIKKEYVRLIEEKL